MSRANTPTSFIDISSVTEAPSPRDLDVPVNLWQLALGNYGFLLVFAGIILCLLAIFTRQTSKTSTTHNPASHETANLEHKIAALTVLADNAFEGLVVSCNNKIIAGNAAAAELLGYHQSELTGLPLLDFAAPESRADAIYHISKNSVQPRLLQLLDKQGNKRLCEVRGRDIEISGQKLRLTAVRDKTQQLEEEMRLLHMARHDQLTDLPNRGFFRETLLQELHRLQVTKSSCAILLFDLSKFKDVNDLYGQSVADQILRKAGGRLKYLAGHTAFVARYGGDEFAVILRECKTQAEVSLSAQRMLDSLAKPFSLKNDLNIRISACVGIALIPEVGKHPDAILAKAGLALKRAELSGKGKLAFFEPSMEASLKERRTIELDLQEALQQGHLSLHYQPQACANTNKIVGYEALLRWNHPYLGPIPPSKFIPIAEESGLIIPIGRWVIQTACRQASKWPSDLRVSINLSPVQFSDEELLAIIERALWTTGLNANQLEFEITESVLIQEDNHVVRLLQRLKEKGIKIALDDFGTGFASLSYLRRFPLDRIKIDRSFVSGAPTSQSLAAIVRTVIALGKALGMEVVAEGVETPEELAFLQKEGCNEVQGFLLGRPSAQPRIRETNLSPDWHDNEAQVS
ncbi:putative bifunctional diguanylate cyclase/phosphodiesterase [Polycladidibacter hongkongensis]|uniref:putative bifunctional diguanylate cyclase/phosphodiesterase n=1 Tax=Polycladidibacter hongkongensis TaxID=1647556 RepID=UPI000835D4A1|nr:EAL domain-containing protein [Pseudovibrio hongkongensis]